jgi:two-component system sensor histidine kinase RegB
LQELVAPYQNVLPNVRIDFEFEGGPEVGMSSLRRWPEIRQGMSTLIENAVDFARSRVWIVARVDDEVVEFDIHDDGPGFAPDILSRLGEPYVTSRSAGEHSPTGHVGLGLGFFIAKTLLERTGAIMTYRNDRAGGAVVELRWKRKVIEQT